jgi:hypothetical protein
MIVASAIKLLDGRVFVGKRHGDCFKNLMAISIASGMEEGESRKLHFNCTQGFVTDQLIFLNREEACFEAGRCNQVKNKKEPPTAYLISEDIW